MLQSAISILFVALSAASIALTAGGQGVTGGTTVEGQQQETKPDARPKEHARSGIKGTLIVLNKAEASASLIDLDTGTELSRIKVGDGPHEVAVTSDGRTAVVANYGQREPGNSLTVISIVLKQPVRTIDLGEYHRPHGIMFMPDDVRVVVTCERERNLLVVNTNSGEIEKVMPTEANVSHMVALSPDASRAFVANIGSHSMTAFDLESGERLAEVPTGREAEGIDVSPDGREVWVSNRRNNTVTIIDASTLEVIDDLDCPAFPIRLKFTPDGSRVLVSNARSADVAVFDAMTREEIARISMDEKPVDDDTGRLFAGTFEGSPVPIGVQVHPSGSHAFIANTQADVITVIDLKELRVAGRLVAGKEPDGLGYSQIDNSPPMPPTLGR